MAVQDGAIRAIRYPPAGQLRARNIVSRSQARATGKYPSWKMGRMLQWESPHELNAFRLLDADPAVVSFSEQPLVLTFELDEAEHEHLPDIRVALDGCVELWEVKTRAEALSPETVRRTALLARSLPALGYEYRVVTAEELRTQPRLGNALTLLRYGRQDIPVADRERLRVLLERVPCLTWGAIRRGAFGPQGRAWACRLALEGTLLIDIRRPWADETPVALNAVAARKW
jgi:hypothetical protein